MNAAEKVISKFGGQSALAKLIGKRQSTVQHWVTSGLIPVRWHSQLLSLAEEQGIVLSASEFTETQEFHVESADADAVGLVEGDNDLPEAKHRGYLNFGELAIPVYVLSDGQRVVGRTSITEMLTGIKGNGDLEKYLRVAALKGFIDLDKVVDQMVSFKLPEVQQLKKKVKGLPADVLIELCKGFMSALDSSASGGDPQMTPRQMQMAIKAGMFVSSCAKVGLDSLIDEATGYQYERAEDALQVKLRAYLEDEMRVWEKTFPDELWAEFGRLTNWKGSVTKRPKYWGKLVMELIYEYLDKDVAQWLKTNKPKPRHGQNYHQWLTSQYGLKKLTEHIWLVVGMASACQNMSELKDKMAQKFGRQPIQYRLYLPMPDSDQHSN